MTNKLVPTIGDLRHAEVVKVIKIERGIGAGIEDDPYRLIKEYWSLDGELLARRDTLEESWKETN